MLFREGDPINRVVFIRSGWVERVSGVEVIRRPPICCSSRMSPSGLIFSEPGRVLGSRQSTRPDNWKLHGDRPGPDRGHRGRRFAAS